MRDTIIKGTGNSRSLRSVPNLATLAPTYDKLLELLTGEGLPIDLGPMNPAGVQQAGTDLNKANLLKDATAALYGLPSTAVPDDALSKAWQLITDSVNVANAKAKIEIGSYVGSGTAGSDNPNSLRFSFTPNCVFVYFYSGLNYSMYKSPLFFIYGGDYGFAVFRNSNAAGYLPASWTQNQVTWSTLTAQLGADHQFNGKEQSYRYVAIG